MWLAFKKAFYYVQTNFSFGLCKINVIQILKHWLGWQQLNIPAFEKLCAQHVAIVPSPTTFCNEVNVQFSFKSNFECNSYSLCSKAPDFKFKDAFPLPQDSVTAIGDNALNNCSQVHAQCDIQDDMTITQCCKKIEVFWRVILYQEYRV